MRRIWNEQKTMMQSVTLRGFPRWRMGPMGPGLGD